MIQLLFKNGFVSLILIIVLAGISWFMPVSVSKQYEVLGLNISKDVALISSFILNVFTAFIFNLELSKRFFVNQRNLAFVFFFLMIFSLSTSYYNILNVTILSFFYTVFVVSLLRINGSNSKVKNVFNTAFFLGVLCLVSLLFFPFVYLIISGIGKKRAVNLKDILFVISGVLTPTVLLYMFAFLTDNHGAYGYVFDYSFIFPEVIPLEFILITTFTLFLSIYSIILIKQKRMLVGGQTINIYNVLVVLLILNVALSFANILVWGVGVFYGCIALSVSVFISIFFIGVKQKYSEILLLLYILILFLGKFFA